MAAIVSYHIVTLQPKKSMMTQKKSAVMYGAIRKWDYVRREVKKVNAIIQTIAFMKNRR